MLFFLPLLSPYLIHGMNKSTLLINNERVLYRINYSSKYFVLSSKIKDLKNREKNVISLKKIASK